MTIGARFLITAVYGDSWVLDLNLNEWTQQNISSGPGARTQYSMVQISRDFYVMYAGGNVVQLLTFNDFWLLDTSGEKVSDR